MLETVKIFGGTEIPSGKQAKNGCDLVLFNRFLVSLEGFDLELGLSCVVFFHVLAVIVL